MNFKIYMLTPHLGDNNNFPNFTADLMTSFTNQTEEFRNKQVNNLSDKNYTHSYTLDEKYKIDANSKKSLTFTMHKNVIVGETYMTNPFVNNIQVGSLLLLVDYYSNHTFFIVTDIKYSFNSINMTYQYTCEDMFSYTTSRLNSGYTLQNDAESEDFIGAKTIDWWVINHIAPDCKIDYQYIPFARGLYLRNDGGIYTFTANSEGKTNIVNLKRILKEAYVDGILSAEIRNKVDAKEELTVEEQAEYDRYQQDHAYYEPFAFSCSNSSANGALVSLADHFDLQIKVFEYLNIKTGRPMFYYWFEPKKNEQRVTGLQYSPYDSVQSFSLGHSAKSLTTILNVEGPEFEDELITLIPSVSPFFYQLFQSPTWDKSNFLTKSYSAYLGPQIYKGYIRDDTRTPEIEDLIGSVDNTVTGTFCYEVSDLTSIKDNFATKVKADFTSVNTDLNNDIYIKQALMENKIQQAFGKLGNGSYINLNETIILSLSHLPIWADKDSIINLYNKVNFANSLLTYQVLQSGERETYFTTPYVHTWKLLLHKIVTYAYRSNGGTYVSSEPLEDTWIGYSDGDELPSLAENLVLADMESLYTINTHYEYYLLMNTRMTLNEFTTEDESNSIYLNFTRDFTTTDYEFAQAADRCPWLENKIIDYSYFKNYNLVSNEEYRVLNDLIYNDLRKINGKLLCYSASYYNALHEKTRILADLTNNFESMSAACQAAIITPYESKGVVSDYSYFMSAYNQMFTANRSNNTFLFNYNQTRTEYFNKYFNAQQRFLRNIYLFRQFWSAPVSVPGDGLYNYELSIDPPKIPVSDTWTYIYYSFSGTSSQPKILDENFQRFYNNEPDAPDYGKPNVTIYQREKTTATSDKKALYQYIPASIVHAQNYQNYLINNHTQDVMNLSTGLFNIQNRYYKRIFKVHIKDLTLSGVYPFKIKPTTTNTGYTGVINESSPTIPVASVNYNGIWLLIKNSERASQYDADEFYTRQIYAISSGDYELMLGTVKADFPEILFSFNLINDTNATEEYIDSSDHYYLVPVYYRASDNTYQSIPVTITGCTYNGIPLISNGSYNTVEFDYSPVAEREIINNWIGTGHQTNIYIPDYEVYLPAPQLIYGAPFIINLLDKEAETQMPVPKDEDSYHKYLPIDTLYWYGIKSTFNVENVSSDPTQKTFSDKFTFYTKDNLVTDVTTENDKQYLPVSFVTEKNVNKFFKRTSLTTNSSTTSVDTQVNIQYPGSAFSKALAKQLWARQDKGIVWTTEDKYGVYYNYWSESQNKLDGYCDTIDFVYSPVCDGEERLMAFFSTGNIQPAKYYPTVFNNLAFTYQSLANVCADNPEKSKLDKNGVKLSDIILKNTLFLKDAVWTRLPYNNTDQVISAHGDYYLLNLSALITGDNALNGNEIRKAIKEGRILTWDPNNLYKTSGIVLYPIVNYMQPISFAGLDWSASATKTTQQALLEYTEKAGANLNYISEDEEIRIGQDDVVYSFILCERRDYRLAALEGLHLNNLVTVPVFTKSGVTFLNDNGSEFQFRAQPGLTNGYYVLEEGTDEYVTPTEFDMDALYYTEHNGDHIRVYTIKQAIDLGAYYYFNSFKNFQEGFQAQPREISLSLVKHIQNGKTITTTVIDPETHEEIKKYSYIFSSEITSPDVYIISAKPNWSSNKNTATVTLNVDGRQIVLNVSVSAATGVAFKDMNNGTFWYRFGRSTQYPLCLSQAAAIEAELTQYWSAAFSASKFCEYYLPEHWTRYANNEENKMFNLLFSNQDGNLIISDSFIPRVEMFSRNGDTMLDKFYWTYDPYVDTTKHTTMFENDWYSDLTPEYVNPKDIQDNEAITDALRIIGADISHFKLEKIGKQTYYYAASGGQYWSELLLNTTGRNFEQFSGLYVMMYKILNQYQPLRLDSYESYKQQQQQMWTSLRARFGYMLLEQAYKNEDATTSDELYRSAYYKFLDLHSPERQYNLTINNVYLLKGYHEQELRIGDPIELMAEDFYDQNDLIYKSLKQFLFISNISYTLRDPSKLTVSVNNIRYSDKLINKLAQLIR